MTALLRAERLSCQNGPHARVASIDLCLGASEIVGLLGTNGAGKSTTLALLAGALAPTAGRIEVLGRDLHRAPREARRAIGLLPERPPLHPDLTVDENLAFAARLAGVARRQVRFAVTRAKERSDLGRLGNRLARRLSRGEAQRAGIAQALVHDPQVLLLDEPTAGLDPIQAETLRQLIRSLRPGRAVLLATHLLPDVEGLCDRVILLHEGRQTAVSSGDDTPTRRIRLRLTASPQPAQLTALPGIASAVKEPDGWWRVQLTADAPPALAERLAAHGWGLEAYVPVVHDLATLFSRLATRGDLA